MNEESHDFDKKYRKTKKKIFLYQKSFSLV